MSCTQATTDFGAQRYDYIGDNLCRIASKCANDSLHVINTDCVAQCNTVTPVGDYFNDQVSVTDWHCSLANACDTSGFADVTEGACYSASSCRSLTPQRYTFNDLSGLLYCVQDCDDTLGWYKDITTESCVLITDCSANGHIGIVDFDTKDCTTDNACD